MLTALIAIILGLSLLVWSADRFVEGAAVSARYIGVPPLLIGMIVIGFGTSTPELLVSGIASFEGNGGLSLGNAYGSNISNIALILGITALISPITVHLNILRKELPILLGATALGAIQLVDGSLSRNDGLVLLSVFSLILGWTIWKGLHDRKTALNATIQPPVFTHSMTLKTAITWVCVGLVLLLISSRLLVWGSVEIAHFLGISDLIIGLTIVAIGTSLPELASSIAAARKGEHDLALGNIIGSNFFNTLAVVGLASLIAPFKTETEVLTRDCLIMALLTIFLFFAGLSFRKKHQISRLEGGFLFFSYIAYLIFLSSQAWAH
jgi:cation:H+ antiporter